MVVSRPVEKKRREVHGCVVHRTMDPEPPLVETETILCAVIPAFEILSRIRVTKLIPREVYEPLLFIFGS